MMHDIPNSPPKSVVDAVVVLVVWLKDNIKVRTTDYMGDSSIKVYFSSSGSVSWGANQL